MKPLRSHWLLALLTFLAGPLLSFLSAATTLVDPAASCYFSFNTASSTVPPVYSSSVAPALSLRGAAGLAPSLATAKAGKGLYFKGNGSFVEGDSAAGLNFGTGDFTICLWIKTSQALATLVQKQADALQPGYCLSLSGGRLVFTLATSSAQASFTNLSSALINNNAWHHVAVTVDRDNTIGGKLYVDGLQILSFDPSPLMDSCDNTANIQLAKGTVGTNAFLGYLDEFYVSRRALASFEITGLYQAPAFTLKTTPVGTWLWDTTLLKSDTTNLFAFLLKKGVTEVYLSVDVDVANSYYLAFIKKARTNGISVHALVGTRYWAQPGYGWTGFDSRMAFVQAYNAKNPANPFKAIHLDVEPYLLDEWTSDRPAVIQQYQASVVHAGEVARSLNLQLFSDIPFWYDFDTYFSNAYGTGDLLEWLFLENDGICIMDYRPSVAWTISGASEEFTYARKHNKQLMVGIETDNGASFIADVFTQLPAAYPGYTNWGISVHYLEPWMIVAP